MEINSYLPELCPFFGIRIYSEILIFLFNTPNITRHTYTCIYLELIKSNMTRGQTFKIKISAS